MTELENKTELLIRSIKQNHLFDNIRFIKSYKNQIAERPVGGLLAVVEIKKIEYYASSGAGLPDYTFAAALGIRLTGGEDVTGEQLASVSISLADEIKNTDIDLSVKKVFVGQTAFDKNTGFFFRDIGVEISDTYIAPAGSESVGLYLNSQAVDGVTEFRSKQKNEGIPLYEFHRSEPYAVINSREYYEITLKTTTLFSVNPGECFDLQIENSSLRFENCRVTDISTAVGENSGVVYMVGIIADRRVTV